MEKITEGKGILAQIEEANKAEKAPSGELTVEKLEEIMSTLSKSSLNAKEVMLYQYCKTVGDLVKRSNLDLNICEDPECTSCQNFGKAFDGAMKEEAKKFK